MTPFPSISVAQRAWTLIPGAKVLLLTFPRLCQDNVGKDKDPSPCAVPVLKVLWDLCSQRVHSGEAFQSPSPECTQAPRERKQLW